MEIGFPVLGVDLSLTLGHTQLKMVGCFFWFCVRERWLGEMPSCFVALARYRRPHAVPWLASWLAWLAG